MKSLLALLLFPIYLSAAEVNFTLTDNSDNEDGFQWEVQVDGQWEIYQTTEANVTTCVIECGGVEAVRACAFNVFGKSENYTNVFETSKPESATDLKRKITVTVVSTVEVAFP